MFHLKGFRMAKKDNPMQKTVFLVLTSILLVSSCTSSSAQSDFGGYSLNYLGNMEPDFVTSTVSPVEHGKTFADNGKVSTGVWHCSRASWSWPSYPVHEVIELLDGEIEMTFNGGARSATLHPGDTFFIPKGATLSWENKGNVLKKYLVAEELPDSLSKLGDTPQLLSDHDTIDLIERDYFSAIHPNTPRS